MKAPEKRQVRLDRAVRELKAVLRENLRSLVLYGSAVRGGFNEETSDLNVLVVLNASTAAAHEAVRDVLADAPEIAPFIVEHRELPRATRVFALKFLSIARDYRVLHGEDVVKGIEVSRELLALLAEQEARNLRMRLVNRFVTTGRDPVRYTRFAQASHAQLVIALSDVLRLGDVELPRGFLARTPVFEKEFGADVKALRILEEYAEQERAALPLKPAELHGGLIAILVSALAWLEKRHPQLPL